MKKYIIKEVETATEQNPNFKGDTQIWYHGKNISRKISSSWEEGDRFHNYYIKKYGYSRKIDAYKALYQWKDFAAQEDREGFWKHTSVEIVEVEV